MSALILVAFRDAPFLYLAVTLLWIFICLLFSNWFPLPATLAAMVSALGIFVFFQGTVGDALRFYVAYWTQLADRAASRSSWSIRCSGRSPHERSFVERLAEVYAHLEQDCRQAARWIRSGEPPPASERRPRSGPRSGRCASCWLPSCGAAATRPIPSPG